MRWPSTRLAELLGIQYPIVQAPVSPYVTPELVAAVSNAGGLGTLAVAMMAPEATRDGIRQVRALTDRAFAVNVFAPLEPPVADPAAVEAMQAALRPYRKALGLAESETPALPASRLDEQLAVLAEERVPAFSFTFGIAPFDALQEAGAIVIGTATTVAEAEDLEAAGVNAIVAQGAEAGGHRGTFRSRPTRRAEPSAGSRSARGGGLVGTFALVPQVVDRVNVPVIAAGGIMDGRGIAAALALGASGAALGTAFLTTRESAASDAYKHALRKARDDATVVTNAYTGRHARMISTPLVEELERHGIAIPPFPLQAALLSEIRIAATEQGRTDLMFLLAGQGAPLARDIGAADLVGALVSETEAVLAA
jgi:nitronate monooxygenase